MSCRDISNASVSSYDTLQQMYVGLGIRRLPTGVYMNVDSSVPSGGINLGLATGEALECFNTLTGITGGSTYNGTALHANIREIRELIDYFRGAGNTGDANVITGEEIDAYVHAYGDSLSGEAARNFDAQEYRDLTVSNIAAYVAIVEYLGGGEPARPAMSGNPAEANTAAIHSFGSVQQMYTGLVGEVSGEGADAARSSAPEDMPADGIPLGVLNETNIQRFADAIGWDPESDPATPLGRNALEILNLIDYFRGDGNLEDGDPNVITSAEVDAYVRAYVDQAHAAGDRTLTFDDHRAVTVGNLRAMVACIQYISNPPAVVPVADAGPGVADAGNPEDAGTGPRVISETLTDAGAVLPAPPAPETERGASSSDFAGYVLGGLALVATGFGLGWLFRGGRGTPPPSSGTPGPSGGTPPPAPRSGSASGSTRSPAPAAPAAPPPPPAAAPAPSAPAPAAASRASAAAPIDDIEAALAEAATQSSPSATGTPSMTGGTPSLVTADNIIISGPNGAPVGGVDEAVVRAQVVLHFRRFLSQGAREALEDGRPLPAGAELVNTAFEREVNEITDRVVSEYYRSFSSEEGREALADLWSNQLSDRGYIVRRGVPLRFLLETVGDYIAENATRASSPFSGGAGAVIRTEAERHAGENEFLERGLRDMMRHIGR